MDTPFYITRLALQNFRNYTSFSLELGQGPVVITGQNGVGKTNLLEAVSLINASRGLRKATLAHMGNMNTNQEGWACYFSFVRHEEDHKVLIKRDQDFVSKRQLFLDGTAVKQSDLNNMMPIIWLTPFMDQIFMESPGSRRRFFDKLLCAYEPSYSPYLYKLDYALRERNRLLKQGVHDDIWLSSLEKKIAEVSCVISMGRLELASKLLLHSQDLAAFLPRLHIQLSCDICEALQQKASLAVEEEIFARLKAGRTQDAEKGSAGCGAHLCDMVIYHLDFDRPAAVCSTGEQKALLLVLILSHACLMAEMQRCKPILLLDEVVAHLDEKRRTALFQALLTLKMQVWMTGTDVDLFSCLQQDGMFIGLST